MPALPHGGAHKSRACSDGAFTIEVHQVRQDRLRAELPQQGRDLPAVVAAVVDEMLHRLPQRVAVDSELQRFVFHHPVEIGLCQTFDEREQPRFEPVPTFLQARNIAELSHIGQRRRRAALEPFQPDPLRAIDVCQRVAHGTEARAHRLYELLRLEFGSRF